MRGISRYVASGSFVVLVACSGAANKDLFLGGGMLNASGADAGPGGSCGLLCAPGTDGGAVTVDKSDGGKLADGDVENTTDASPNGLLDAGCTPASATKQPAYVLLVVDGSGSMTSDNKWSSIPPILDGLFDDMKTAADPSLGVGMIVFSDTLDSTNGSGPYPSPKDIGIAYVEQGQHDALRARVDTAQAGNGSPNLLALTAGYRILENFVPGSPLPAGGKKILVFMSDGLEPMGGATEQAQILVAATDALSKGISSYGVHIGPFPSTDVFASDPKPMGQFTQAGGTGPAGCNPLETLNAGTLCPFQITPSAKPASQVKVELMDALNRVRRKATACEYGIPVGSDPSQFNVVFKDGNGQENIIPESATDGFTFDDATTPTKVLLHGASCEAAKADAKGSVSFLTGCPTTH